MKTPFLASGFGILLVSFVVLSTAAVHRAEAQPTLLIEPDPAGLKISWDATAGADFVLEASDDFAAWTEVTLSIVQEDGRNRVLIPADQVNDFYRLKNFEDGQTVQKAYVGSARCATCHQGTYDNFIKSGHPYKLNEVNGAAPEYPFTEVPRPPEGYTWDDISWVIGGAIYKTRFVDLEGYIITGDAVQYNFETEQWVGYHSDEPAGTKPYNCGSCHTTGWDSIDEGAAHQGGLAGMHGSFAAPGIQCEACHGPGSRHVTSLSKNDIVKDDSSALCGTCHIRGDAETIPASGGFIRHHEQYNEMLSSPKKNFSCNTCHNPHISVKHGQEGGIIKDCTDCHSEAEYGQDFHSAFADCSTCHMPKASKTAVAQNKYTADIMTHIFKINTDPDAPMFTEDESQAVGGYVTLSYVCYRCHKDPDGVGGNGSTKTLGELSSYAEDLHE